MVSQTPKHAGGNRW